MKVNIQIQGTAKTLNQCHSARLSCLVSELRNKAAQRCPYIESAQTQKIYYSLVSNPNVNLEHKDVVISGTGVYSPENIISNEELVKSFNTYADLYNTNYHKQIKQDDIGFMVTYGGGYSFGSIALKKLARN